MIWPPPRSTLFPYTTLFRSRIDLTDVVFENCDLSNADFMGANIHRVEFRDCKMLGINLSESSLRNVLFDHCILNLSAFGFSSLRQVRFDDCSLKNADCYECKFTKVSFDQSDLNDVNFFNTPLKGIDLSPAQFERLSVSLEDLAGCEVSKDQAIGFAAMIGLKIKE